MTDSLNNNLTIEQENYFKDTVVRNSRGQLQVVYHGSPNNSFKEFIEAGLIWFTPHKQYANEFTLGVGVSRKFYLLLKNPLDLGNIDVYINVGGKLNPKCIAIADKLGVDPQELFKGYEDKEDKLFLVTNSERFSKILESSNYDGVTAIEEGLYRTYGVLHSNQVKSIFTKTPTSSKKINESTEVDKLVSDLNDEFDKVMSSYEAPLDESMRK